MQAPAPRPGPAPWLLAAAGALGLIAVGSVAALMLMGGGNSSAPATPLAGEAASETPIAASGGPLPGLQSGDAPWPPEQEQLPARLDAIGIPFSNMEGTALHIHPSLSVFVNGRPVEVPKDIGISYAEQAMAALHTHDTAGTIHVESPEVREYTLGQFFDVWGVRLTKRCLGSYCGRKGNQLRAFADGQPVSNPRALELADGEQIVVAYGTPAQIKSASS